MTVARLNFGCGILLFALLFLSAVETTQAQKNTAKSKGQSSLIGKWQCASMVLDFKSATDLTFNGENATYAIVGGTIKIMSKDGTEQYPYQLNGDRLTIQFPGTALMFQRIGGGDAAAGEQAQKEQGGGNPKTQPNSPQDQLSQLLLSSAWCSFSYSKISGATSTSRVRFFANGTYAKGSQNETYSSGYGGTYSGQSNSGNSGQWTVRNGVLYMSSPPETPNLMPLNLQISRNSNGYPILQVAGKEYSQCK